MGKNSGSVASGPSQKVNVVRENGYLMERSPSRSNSVELDHVHDNSVVTAKRRLALGVFHFFLHAAFAYVVVIAGLNAMNSPIAALPGQSLIGRNALPQGWGFYTRSPREEETMLYGLQQDGSFPSELRVVYDVPLTDPSWAWGLNRQGRHKAFMADDAVSQASTVDWLECSEFQGLEQCFEQASATANVTAVTPNEPVVCGPHILLQRTPVPWAFASKGVARTTFPTGRERIKLVDFTCG